MMKYSSSIGYALVFMLVTACGTPTEFMSQSGETEETGSTVAYDESYVFTPSTRAVNGAQKTQDQKLASIKANLPRLKSAKPSGVKLQPCPAGVDQACLDALLLAFSNSKFVKSMATYSRGSLSYIQNGNNAVKYVGVAQQPAVNTGFTLTESSLKQDQFSLATPISAAIGDLFISSKAPAAGIGAFAVLTDQSSIAGIAGGFAGADVTGWIEGAFYCYLQVVNGTPTGACVPVPVASGGW